MWSPWFCGLNNGAVHAVGSSLSKAHGGVRETGSGEIAEIFAARKRARDAAHIGTALGPLVRSYSYSPS